MKIEVFYLGGYSKTVIGHLSETADGTVLFQYTPEWAARGIELSPIHLPTSHRDAVATPDPGYSPLFGLFSDSLPDWWGVQMMQKFFEEKGIPWSRVSSLQKLSCTGFHAMGALGYLPPPSDQGFREKLTIEVAELVDNAQGFIHGQTEQLIPGLMRAGILAGGAQPKVVLGFNKDFSRAVAGGGHVPMGFERWLLKFDFDPDYQNGKEEHAYAMMARACGINMAKTHLLKCANNSFHFLSKRFDRPGDEYRHIHTYSGMTHTPIRDGLSYNSLIELTKSLTSNSDQVDEIFRRACFNVLAGNDDDHGKNHAFMMNLDGSWQLTPAYDLTHSSNPLANGMRAAAVNGKRIDVTTKDLLELAQSQDIQNASDILDQVIQGIREWPQCAEQAGLTQFRIDEISDEIKGHQP